MAKPGLHNLQAAQPCHPVSSCTNTTPHQPHKSKDDFISQPGTATSLSSQRGLAGSSLPQRHCSATGLSFWASTAQVLPNTGWCVCLCVGGGAERGLRRKTGDAAKSRRSDLHSTARPPLQLSQSRNVLEIPKGQRGEKFNLSGDVREGTIRQPLIEAGNSAQLLK